MGAYTVYCNKFSHWDQDALGARFNFICIFFFTFFLLTKRNTTGLGLHAGAVSVAGYYTRYGRQKKADFDNWLQDQHQLKPRVNEP